jgi:peptidoglycan hydrolase CwlO-like protein
MEILSSTIIAIVSAVSGAAVTGFYNVWVQKTKNVGNNESVYAEHTEDMWKRLDDLTYERDDFKSQVITLQAEVEEQTRVIDQLNKQIGELSNKFEELER